MVAIFVVALAFGLGVPAAEVYRENDYHSHSDIEIGPEGRPSLNLSVVTNPFWPRYWRRVVGQPWKGFCFCEGTPEPRAQRAFDTWPESRKQQALKGYARRLLMPREPSRRRGN